MVVDLIFVSKIDNHNLFDMTDNQFSVFSNLDQVQLQLFMSACRLFRKSISNEGMSEFRLTVLLINSVSTLSDTNHNNSKNFMKLIFFLNVHRL